MKKQNSIITAVIATLVVIVAVTAGTYINDRMMEKVATKMGSEKMKDDTMEMDESVYNLAFLSGVSYQPNIASPLEFTVLDKNGKRLHQDDYKIEHEKRMHVIVVNNDLSQFQHVHPVFDTSTNSFKLPDFVFPTSGNYRVYTDFTIGSHDGDSGHKGVQYQDVTVGTPSHNPAMPLGNPTNTALVDGNKVDLEVKSGKSGLERKLTFTLMRDGQKVTDLQKYLGALGHLVVIREGDLEYIHTHTKATDITKQNGKVDFTVDFTQPGTYKAFAQFQRDGKVMTASYVIVVK
jgi:hypothetical protein